MKKERIKIPSYTLKEELINSISHGLGAIFGIVALILLVIKAAHSKKIISVVCASIFGTSIILLYTLSCIYHALSKNLKGKKVLRVIDHCNVFLLVYGTYLPVTLIAVGGRLGWILFSLVTIVTIIGIVLSSINVDKYEKLEVCCHLFNGWSILLGIKQMLQHIGTIPVLLMLIGGVIYSLGVILYHLGSSKKYMHSVFHFFCIAGTIFHFIAIYVYVL